MVQDTKFNPAIYVCDNGTVDGVCQSNSPTPPVMNTTFRLYTTSASLVVSRFNNSILSASDASTPIPDYSLDVQSYRSALRWILNYTAAGIPAPSSPVEYFWSAPEQLSSQYWSSGPRQAFQSLLAYPLWFFNVNNVGNLALWNGQSDDFTLPEQYQTTASVASPLNKIVVNRTMFVIFVVLQVSLAPVVCRQVYIGAARAGL